MIDLFLLAIPVFFVTMALEAYALRTRPDLKGYEVRDTRTSLAMGTINVVLTAATKGAQFFILSWLARYAIWHIEPWTWQSWVLGTIAVDFCYYWFHRCSHDVRLLWAAHVNHHSSEHYNLSTALRQSLTTPLTGMPFYWVLPILGFDPAMILVLGAVNTLYQYWIHTELVDRIGPLEAIFNTASHHRVHHGTNVQYLDRNHAGIFIVWDKLFGTFEPEREAPVYGLTKNIRTFDLWKVAFHEFEAIARDLRRARSLREACGYLFAPPGWSPDGSTLTSNQMRASLAR
jgi:sterol desaturase/sphingolipid hydroxylase (fatty acid hydroxylase superfamily)